MITLVGGSRWKCYQDGGRWDPMGLKEKVGQQPHQRNVLLAALTKADLQISSLGSSLGPHRAPVSLDSLSPGNL